MVALTEPVHAVDVRATVPVQEESTLPFASCADTRTPIDVPAVVVLGTTEYVPPLVTANLVTAPTVPVAVKVTGEPVSPDTVAVRVFDPAVVPRVHEVTAAMPEEFVDTVVVGRRDPPPDATAKVTAVPDTGLPPESVTMTDGAVETADPAVALWLLPAFTAIVAAAPTVTVTDAVAAVSAPSE
jgi:hypothetical protein